ncbi:MAG: hypothetical protein PVJ67_01700 [Candidatus Pacearchaeota archaeon]|jgi:hypothetical protein
MENKQPYFVQIGGCTNCDNFPIKADMDMVLCSVNGCREYDDVSAKNPFITEEGLAGLLEAGKITPQQAGAYRDWVKEKGLNKYL